MMKRAIRNIAALTWAAFTLGYSPLWAQKVKSPKEQQALLAVQVAATPDAKVQAIESVLTNFADTEFKVPLLQMAMQLELQKDDYAQVVFYGERLLMADPKNAFALINLASETARHTRENDLNKDESLAKVDKWAKDGIEAAKIMPKIRPDVPDADWDSFKKDMEAQGYVALGMADMLKKNMDGAANDFRQSIEIGATPNPGTLVRLAQVYLSAGKVDNAIFTLDKAINTPNVPDQVKTVAETLKAQANKAKAAAAAKSGASPGAAGAAPPAPPPASENKP
jgi:tetratricopeptide (TPR) repeat protein